MIQHDQEAAQVNMLESFATHWAKCGPDSTNAAPCDDGPSCRNLPAQMLSVGALTAN